MRPGAAMPQAPIGAISLDAEAMVLMDDWTFFIGDEYGLSFPPPAASSRRSCCRQSRRPSCAGQPTPSASQHSGSNLPMLCRLDHTQGFARTVRDFHILCKAAAVIGTR